MKKQYVILLLILTILFGLFLLFYVLNFVGIINAQVPLPFFKDSNPVVVDDKNFPTEVEKERFQKWQERLSEQEEAVTLRQAEVETQLKEIEQKMSEIERTKQGLLLEKQRLQMLTNDQLDRNQKISDMAAKVTSMKPEAAVAMMVNWPDFDIIDVLREIDRQADDEGTQSLSPYLLTLFAADRRAEITRKMLLPPLQQENSIGTGNGSNGYEEQTLNNENGQAAQETAAP